MALANVSIQVSAIATAILLARSAIRSVTRLKVREQVMVSSPLGMIASKLESSGNRIRRARSLRAVMMSPWPRLEVMRNLGKIAKLGCFAVNYI